MNESLVSLIIHGLSLAVVLGGMLVLGLTANWMGNISRNLAEATKYFEEYGQPGPKVYDYLTVERMTGQSPMAGFEITLEAKRTGMRFVQAFANPNGSIIYVFERVTDAGDRRNLRATERETRQRRLRQEATAGGAGARSEL